MLLDCAANGNDGVCEWYKPPAKPGTAAAAKQDAANREAARSLIGTPVDSPLCDLVGGNGGWLTCQPFARRLG
jgi:hypothetical protein